MNVIRFNLPWEGKIDSEIDALQELKGACDEAWLGLWGYYTEERHAEMEVNFAHAIERFKKAGIRYVFEMGANLGHSDSAGESPVTESFRNMMDMFGKSFHGTYCPRCENLRAYQHKVITRYAKYQPYAVMIDDDTRLELHGALSFGCFCDVCIGLFNERYGYALSRDEIRRRFLTDGDFHRQYMEFDREGLADYAGFIAGEVKAVSPESRMGYENVFLGGFHGGNHTHIWEALHRVSGRDVIARSGAGNYTDERPRDVLSKLLTIQYQNSQLPPYVTTRRPEIENNDYTSMGKSVRGTMMESEIDLAFGCNGTSYHMIGECGEPVSFEKRYFKALAAEHPYFEKLVQWNKNSKLSGIHPVLYEDAYAHLLTDEAGVADVETGKRNSFFWACLPTDAGRELWQVGLPISYEDDGAYLLHTDMIRFLSDEQIRELLGKNVLADGSVLQALAARGFGDSFPAQAVARGMSADDTYLPHPITQGLSQGHANYFGTPCGQHVLVPSSDAAGTDKFVPLAAYGNDTTVALLKTKEGGTWGIFGNQLYRIMMSSGRRAFLLNLADALVGGFAARLLSAEQAVVIPRKNAAGQCTGVFMHSISIGDTEELTFEVLNPASLSFVWMTPDGRQTKCAYKFDAAWGRYLVHTPALPAYRSGLLLCDDALL